MPVDNDDLHYISHTRSRLAGKSYRERVQIMRSAATGAPNRGVKRRIDRMLHVEQSRHARKVFVQFLGVLLLAAACIFVLATFGNHGNKKSAASSSSKTSIAMSSANVKKHKQAKKSSSSSKASSSTSSSSASVSTATSTSSSSSSVISSSSSSRSSSSSSRSSSRASSSSVKKAVTTNSSPSTYTIKNGDNLYRIAANNNISLAKLKQINHMTDDANLQPGQTIRLK